MSKFMSMLNEKVGRECERVGAPTVDGPAQEREPRGRTSCRCTALTPAPAFQNDVFAKKSNLRVPLRPCRVSLGLRVKG